MGRPERALDPLDGPVQAFAAELRKLRQDAGNPKYLQMQRLTGRSRTALAEAAGGDHLATWETVEAYVRACGGDRIEWERRWETARAAIDARRDQTAPPRPGGSVERPRSRRWPVTVTAAAGLIAVGLFFGVLRIATAPHLKPKANIAPSRPVVIVIQNKVAIGSTTLTEDTTPAYLSTKTIPYCAKLGCEVAGTDMWSGAVLKAICQTRGTTMTNENTLTAGITRNKGGIVSSLWYRCVFPNGKAGYISEVYVASAYRGGLGLRPCS